MSTNRSGQIAVIFVNQRNGEDAAGYDEAAQAMVELVTSQPGYCGHESTRNADGLGITISYWAKEADAIAWRDQPDHARIREQGRALWYDWYRVEVATLNRAYDWQCG
jgi:heme-degrading monooxygenase HmoA